jgi:hypothetical protein
VFISHFPHVWDFLAIFQVKQCFSHFPPFSFLSPYSRSYSVHFSFSTFFIVSRHISAQFMFVSHFPCFSVLSP